MADGAPFDSAHSTALSFFYEREVEARILPPMPSGESLLPSFFALSSRTDLEFALVAGLPAHRSRHQRWCSRRVKEQTLH